MIKVDMPLETILKTGLSAKPSEFIQLTNLDQLFAIVKFIRSLNRTLNALEKLAKVLSKKYRKSVKKHHADLQALVGLRQVFTCYNFFTYE